MENNYNYDPMTGEKIIRNGSPVGDSEQERANHSEYSETGAKQQTAAYTGYPEAGAEQGRKPYETVAGNAGNEYEGMTQTEESRKTDATWVSSYEEETKEKAKKARKARAKTKKPWGFFRKAVAAVALAAIFGGAAGGTFYGICYGTGLLTKYEQAASQAQSSTENKEITTIKQVETGDSQDVKIAKSTSKSLVTTDISEMVDEVIPAMVTIVNTGSTSYDFFGRSYTSQSSGSGIIIGQNDNELLIVTNHHVAEGAQKLEITFIDDTKAEAKVKGMDSDMDLAVIAVDLNDLSDETKAAIAIAKIGDSDNLKLGQPAIVIGNALGIGISVTSGVISGIDREMTREDGVTETFIQTDAAVNHGNSGGALLDIEGNVIGITSGKLGGDDVDNMGYAIPISAAYPIISELMEHETRKDKVAEEEMGYLGIRPQDFDESARSYYNIPEGVFVYSVYKNSGADKAGIYRGDVITKLEKEKVSSLSDLKSILQYYKAGDVVKVTIKRLEAGEYVEHELEVTLSSADDLKE